MNEDDLVKCASRAAGEPIGAAKIELAELDHAMAVLRGATVDATDRRNLVLMQRTNDATHVLRLWHFAAAAVVFFCIGLVVLVKVGFTPPEVRPPIAEQHPNEPEHLPATNSPANKPQIPPDQVYTRPEWIKLQAISVANTPEGRGMGAPGGGLGGGSSGGGDHSGGSTGNDWQFGSPSGPGFKLLYPSSVPGGMELTEAKLLPASETGVGFALQRIEYAAPGRALVLLEAADTAESRRALDGTGLQGSAVSMVRDGTVVLLMSNTLDAEALRAVAGKLVEKP